MRISCSKEKQHRWFAIFRILAYFKRYPLIFIIFIIAGVMAPFAELIGYSMVLPLIGGISGSQYDDSSQIVSILNNITSLFPTDHKLLCTSLMIMGLIALKGVLVIVNLSISAWLLNNISADLRRNVYNICMDTDYQDLSLINSFDLANNLTSQTERTALVFGGYLRVITKSISILLFVVALMILSWKMTLLSGLIIAVITAFIRYYYIVLKRLGERWNSVQGKYVKSFMQGISGIHLIRSMGTEKQEKEKQDVLLDDYRRVLTKEYMLRALYSPIFEVLVISIILILLGYSATTNSAGVYSINPLFATFLLVLYRLIPQFNTMNCDRLYISLHGPALAGIRNFISKYEPRRTLSAGTVTFNKLTKGINVQDVSFSYKGCDAQILNGISLNIKANACTSIVGSSGAGKSTLINVIAGLHEPNCGSIIYDDVPISEYDMNTMRRKMSIVGQKIFLFNDTIANNIMYGADYVDNKRLEDVLEQAHVAEFVSKLKRGIHTVVGEGAANLSGGQIQRIAIARALYRDCSILIFDEATSALDSESEAFIQDTISNLQNNITIIIVGHRYSTISIADYIYVMKGGRIECSGSIDEVINRSEHFHALYGAQLGRVNNTL